MNHGTAGTVYVVDDDESMRRGLRRLFRSVGYSVVTFSLAEEFLLVERTETAACLVLDFCMPGLNGIELQEKLCERERAVPIIFLTGLGDVPICAGAMKAGAVDFLPKPFNDKALLDAVARALEQDANAVRSWREHQAARAQVALLTPREFEVMRHLISGKPNKVIAADLGTAEQTIKIHRGRVLEKMAAASIVDLSRTAQIARIQPA